MKRLTQSHDYLAGLALLRQEYVAAAFNLKSAGGLTATHMRLLREELRDNHRLRCAQEWKAISDQIRADQDVWTTP